VLDSTYGDTVIEDLVATDGNVVAELWEETGLARPWNDSLADFNRALTGPTSTVLGCRVEGELVGTVMVGHDGHRGWVYYLAVRPSLQRSGRGAELMDAAEGWLRRRGVVKVQLMVRHSNTGVLGFYENRGYEDADVAVLGKWLTSSE
jgi:ribosomal protein S18 acetylase RimI-like enzyme